MHDVYSYAQAASNHRPPPRRSLSTGDKYSGSPAHNAQQTIDDLQIQVSELKQIVERCRKDNLELRKAVDRAEVLLQMEQVGVRQLERQKLVADDEICSLREEIEALKLLKRNSWSGLDERRNYLDPFDNSSEYVPQAVRHPSLTDLDEKKRPQRKLSAPSLSRSPSVSKAKTLCFQISFNGMTLMEKTDFGE